MKDKEIIQTLKKDIQELNNLKQKYNFTKCFIYNKYSIFLNVFITENNNCFNKIYREIQFKTLLGANKFIMLLNNDLKTNIKRFKK